MNADERLISIREGETRGDRQTYLFFWGHQPTPSGQLGPSCLSQWWESPFLVDGVKYQTAEHWMMAAKARLFEDETALARILASFDPHTAKAAGRAVKGFDDAIWAAQRQAVVIEGNLAKFAQHDDLADFLLGTGDRVLAEASPDDRIWGIGLASNNTYARRPLKWPGKNLLGFALMEVRDRLRAG